MQLGDAKIVLVHDELVRRGGAEIVFEEMARIFPQADIYALYAGRPQMTINGITRPIHTSFLQKLPRWLLTHPSRILPLLPYAAEELDLSHYDVVISSASGFAKAIVTRSNIPHICYCHTPTRYLWDATHEITARLTTAASWPARAVLHYLRLVDFASAQRVDHFIANSQYTAQRITAYYRRPSTVIYPPIDTAFFTPGLATHRLPAAERPFLIVGRLSESKHFEQAIAVCKKLGFPLVVVGQGADLPRLKRFAGKQTIFTGRISAEELRRYLREARALLQPTREDFGMAAAEALACGTPVIALDEGGVKEIITGPEYGILYNNPRAEGLAEAMRRFLLVEHTFGPVQLQKHASRFSAQRFSWGLQDYVAGVLNRVVS